MKIKIKTTDWIIDSANGAASIKDGRLVIDNKSGERITVNYRERIDINEKNCGKMYVKFDGDVENSGGYLGVNGFSVPIQSECVMPLSDSTTIELTLVVSAKSSISVPDLELEFASDVDLLDRVRLDHKILVIAPQYPSYANLYVCAFAHSRVREYVKSGLDVQVFVPTSWYQTSYERNGIPVFSGTYEDLKKHLSEKHYDVTVVHFVDMNLFPILDANIYDNQKLIFICHSPETLYRYLTRTTGTYFTVPEKSQYFDPRFDAHDEYVRKYAEKDNVEWVFVSDWLKDFSESEQKLKFRHARVINNIIDEDLFPYTPKKAEDRKKILMIRKFDNTREHGIDLVVLAILALSRREIFDDLEFDIYGDGNYYETLVEPLKQFRNVHLYRKFLPNEELNSIYRSHGIMILASRTDAHAVSMGESASTGLVVLGTKVTSNPYFMNEKENHTLADPEHYEQIADIIERLYNDPDEFLQISERMATFTRQFNKEHTVAKEIALINECVEDVKGKAPFTLSGAKTDSPVLTIGVPAYNVEKYIGKCLISILRSRNAHKTEVLVINDGSTDGTAEIVKEFEKTSGGIVRLINKENGGHGSGINRTIEEAKGKYLRFVDGDDWVDHENLAKLIDYMETSDADVILTKGSYDYIEKPLFEDIIKYDSLKEGVTYYFDDLVYDNYGFKTYGPILTSGNYKTEVLRKADFRITEKKPYVDMEFNSFSIKYVNSVEYRDLDIYRYLIGRVGQTVSKDFWRKKYKDHVYIIFNILDKVSNDPDYSANKKKYVYKNIISQMVDSQIFMFDAVCKYDELDEFLERLKNYPEAYDYSMKLIKERGGNCLLILKLCKYFKKTSSTESIIIPGKRETLRDLLGYPKLASKLEDDASAGLPASGNDSEYEELSSQLKQSYHGGIKSRIKRLICAVTPYGLVVSRRLRQERK